jgi:hypothetical protein
MRDAFDLDEIGIRPAVDGQLKLCIRSGSMFIAWLERAYFPGDAGSGGHGIDRRM